MTYACFDAPIRVVGKERPRVARGRAFTPKRTADCEKEIAAAALAKTGELLNPNPVRVVITLYYKGVRRPDVDNAAKTVLDALNGVWWIDDSQVWSLSVSAHACMGASGIQVEAFFDEPAPNEKTGRTKK